jgi:glycine oxidase
VKPQHIAHVAIAGAGLAGRLLAWRCLRAGQRVSLFDAAARDDGQSAAMTAAAMLSPLAELAVADADVFALAQRSMALWPAWIDELAEDSGQRVYFRQQGTVVVAHAPDVPMLTRFTQVLQHKLPGDQRARLQPVDTAELSTLEPALAGRFNGGLFLEGEGQLANDELMAALATAIDQRGGHWVDNCAVESVQRQQLHTAQGVVDADLTIDARGVGARSHWPALRGVRGEVITVECAGITLHRPVRLMHPRYQLYIAPRPNQRFVVGATELESEDTGPTTLRSMLELGSALYSLHPAFGEARVIRLAAALRPTLDNNCPTLVQREGVWHLNGLYRHGFLCAPALVERLVHVLAPSPLWGEGVNNSRRF